MIERVKRNDFSFRLKCGKRKLYQLAVANKYNVGNHHLWSCKDSHFRVVKNGAHYTLESGLLEFRLTLFLGKIKLSVVDLFEHKEILKVYISLEEADILGLVEYVAVS